MIGACALEDIAVRIGARVIGHYPHRNQLLIDVGWTALSLDGQGQIPNGSYCLFEDEPNLRFILFLIVLVYYLLMSFEVNSTEKFCTYFGQGK